MNNLSQANMVNDNGWHVTMMVEISGNLPIGQQERIFWCGIFVS